MPEVFVPPEWVATNRESVVLVDVREPWEYADIGHLPGAVNVPFESFRSEDGGAGMLPARDTWERLLSEAGATPADTLVAYDDTHGVFAARFLVTAHLLGHDPAKLKLLDGDFSAWRREFETSDERPSVDPTAYAVDPPEATPRVEFESVAAALEDPETVLVDTRKDWEFAEGHLPGAVQLDWLELVDDESRGLKPEADLRAILSARGIVPDKRILLYCNTARRISHTYLVLRQLDYPDLAFYEGSLTEWEARGGEVVSADAGAGQDPAGPGEDGSDGGS